MVDRIDIECALDDIVSHQEGFRFQVLAVALATKRWPELVAHEWHKDRGLDAYASANSAQNRVGKGLSVSITATIEKLKDDADKALRHFDPFSLFIFATPKKVSVETEQVWAKELRERYGYELEVMPREDFINSLQKPENVCLNRAGNVGGSNN